MYINVQYTSGLDMIDNQITLNIHHNLQIYVLMRPRISTKGSNHSLELFLAFQLSTRHFVFVKS